MQNNPESLILQTTNADAIAACEKIQSLWSNYGSLNRYRLSGGETQSIIVKHIQIPERIAHPRGWNTKRSHQRKIDSYQVERHWYQYYSKRCTPDCRVPQCLAAEAGDNEVILLLEDLDSAGFARRISEAGLEEIQTCLKWLAHFHAAFMGHSGDGLWPTGTYWHLDTRPDELQALEDPALKSAAAEIDRALTDCPYQTLVHGDAKLANFCFSQDGRKVAAVDFQYVGRGCGMKDVAYFIGSCLNEDDCHRYEQALLHYYFQILEQALCANSSSIHFADLEQSWRPMYAFAWADFHRFVKGWSPEHWKLHSYSEALTQDVLKELQSR